MRFLSLGSNYTFLQAVRHLFTVGRKKDADNLIKFLNEKYSGQQTLLYSRGRDALASAIKIATGGEGSVLVTSLTCYSVVEAVESAGCQVVYAESDPKTLQYNFDSLALALSNDSSIKTLVVQNMLGIPVDIMAIKELTDKHGVVLIEDLAHSVGGKYDDGTEIGTVGDYVMLSFGRDKLLDTINGGALVIRTREVGRKITPPTVYPGFVRQFRDRIYPSIGWTARALFRVNLGKYYLAFVYKLRLAVRSADGDADISMRLPKWQTKLALRQLTSLVSNIESRQSKQDNYLDRLASFSPKRSSNAVRTPLLIKNRDEIIQSLKNAGYYTEDIWYEVPVSPTRLYHLVDFPETEYPVATALSRHIVNLPTHQLINDRDIENIISIIENEAQSWK